MRTARLALIGALAAGCSQPKPPPNIVVVALDTLRRDRVGLYGHSGGLTPNIDALANDSVTFEAAYSQANETLFSFGSLLTSRYASELGPPTLEWRIPQEVPTLPEVLGTYEYSTAGFVAGGHLAPDFGLDRGFAVYHNSERDYASLGASVDAAADWIAEQQGPFFALVHGYDLHSRYLKPPPFAGQTAQTAIGRAVVAGDHASEWIIDDTVFPPHCLPLMAQGDTVVHLDRLPSDDACRQAGLALGEADVEALASSYDGAVAWADAQLGLLLGELESQGRLDDTVIVVLSDHGEELGEAGRFGHRHSLSDAVVRVPLVVRPPGGTQESTIEGMVELTDVMPTLLSYAGATPPAHAVGHDLRGAIAGGPAPSRALAVTESWAQGTRLSTSDGALIFRGLGWDHPAFAEMLAWAPAEGPALSESTAPPPSRDMLKAKLIAWRAARHMEEGQPAALTEDLEEALREGGYWQP